MATKYVVYWRTSRTRYTPSGHETVYGDGVVNTFDTEDSAKLAAMMLNTMETVLASLNKSVWATDMLRTHYDYKAEET